MDYFLIVSLFLAQRAEFIRACWHRCSDRSLKGRWKGKIE